MDVRSFFVRATVMVVATLPMASWSMARRGGHGWWAYLGNYLVAFMGLVTFAMVAAVLHQGLRFYLYSEYSDENAREDVTESFFTAVIAIGVIFAALVAYR